MTWPLVHPRRKGGVVVLLSTLLLCTVGGCTYGDDGFTIVLEDGTVYASWSLASAVPVAISGFQLPAVEGDDCDEQATSLLSDTLRAIINSSDPADTLEVIISYRDTLSLPYLADAWNIPIISNTFVSLADSLIEDIRRRRLDSYNAKIDSLGFFGARATNWFWIIRALQVRVPAGKVLGLSGDPEVEFISSADVLWPPPQLKYVADGRDQIGSDPYFTSVPIRDRIAVFDVGVRSSHGVFTNAVINQYDCPNQLPAGCSLNNAANLLTACFASCTAVSPPPDLQDCSFFGHGTKTTAIIAGTAAQGNMYRGVTSAPINFYRAFERDTTKPCTLSVRYVGPPLPVGCLHEYNCVVGSRTNLVLHGIQNALADSAFVLAMQVQENEPFNGPLSRAADNAYDVGAVVVVANGNEGGGDPPPSSVRSPANAHKALGAGAYLIDSLTTDSEQTRGPTGDCRIKPDVQTPTETMTAASDGDLQWGPPFGNTSGSTPYLGAAAGILRSMFREHGAQSLPGFTYSGAILAGDYFRATIDNEVGAGRLHLPETGILRFRRVTVGPDNAVAVPIKPGPNVVGIDGAVWWPEDHDQVHNTMSLFFINPNGAVVGASRHRHSVFQRARASSPETTGDWKLVVWNEGESEQEAFVGIHVTKDAFATWEKFLFWLYDILDSSI